MNLRSFASLLAYRPRTIVFLFTVFTILVGSQAANIYMESDLTIYLPKDDPVIELWEEINQEYQIGSTIIILINQEGMRFDYVTEYEVLDEMDGIWDILVGNPQRYGKNSGIAFFKSLAQEIKEEHKKATKQNVIPRDQNLINDYMQKITIANMKGVLYTSDLRYAVIIIQLENDADYEEVLARTQKAVENRGTKHTNMTITGTIAFQKAVKEESMKNILIIFPIALILVAVVLFYFHRNFKGIIIAFIFSAFRRGKK